MCVTFPDPSYLIAIAVSYSNVLVAMATMYGENRMLLFPMLGRLKLVQYIAANEEAGRLVTRTKPRTVRMVSSRKCCFIS